MFSQRQTQTVLLSPPPHRYGGGSFSFSNLINGVTKRFSTKFELQQVRDAGPEGSKLLSSKASC